MWLGVAAVLAAVWIVWLSLGLTFFQDEWRYILDRELTIASALRPSAEHWASVMVLTYRSLLAVFGLGSYLPFVAVLVALHLVAAGAVYRLLEAVSPGRYALAGSVLFLFAGAGAENLLWAGQIGFIASIAFGLWALVLVPDRPRRAAVLLVLAVASHGPGLVLLAACGARNPRATPWLLVPAGAYVSWAVTFGASGFSHRLTVDGLVALPFYVITGITVAAGSLVGRYEFATGAVVVLTGCAGIYARRRDPAVRAAVVGLLAEFAVIGLVRSQGGPDTAGASRYIYLAMPFMLIAGATLGSLFRPRVALALGTAAFVVVLAAQLVAFGAVRQSLAIRQDHEQAIPPELRGL